MILIISKFYGDFPIMVEKLKRERISYINNV